MIRLITQTETHIMRTHKKSEQERERESETDKYNTQCNQMKTFADANQFNDAENLFY